MKEVTSEQMGPFMNSRKKKSFLTQEAHSWKHKILHTIFKCNAMKKVIIYKV